MNPTMLVYCEGPDDAPHERFRVRTYQRVHATPTPVPTLWEPVGDGRETEQDHDYTPGLVQLRFRLHCKECGLDDKPNAETAMLPIFAVFDARWHSGKDEVSARFLVAAIEAANRAV